MLGRTDRRLRMVALLVAFVVFAGAAMARLSYWQLVAAPELVAQAVERMRPPPTPPPARAEIVDRQGTTLAQTITYDRLIGYPAIVPPERRVAIVDELAGILELDPDQRRVYLRKLSDGEDEWELLAPRLTPQQSITVQLALDEGTLRGIALDAQQTRAYPRRGGQTGTTLASHLVGFVAGDSGGAYGLEREYDGRLSGREPAPAVASLVGSSGGLGEGGLSDESVEVGLPPLRLTIDAELQHQVEVELNTVRIVDRAKSVSAVIMDAHTGAIYASASVPAYDATDYAKVFRDDPSALRDRVISDTYEPGSVMKMFTVAAALSEGVVTPSTPIRDQVRLRFGDEDVHNSDRKSLGTRPVKTIIAESRNVGTSKIAQRLAPNSTQKASRLLYETWQRLGVTGRTGVDISGEEAGIARDPTLRPWQAIDLANGSFGQGVSVTLLQLATGYAPMMNGGFRVQPHVAAESAAARVPPERVLRPKIARQTRDILTWVTGSVSRYAKGALIRGYMIGGKTGTAQIWDSARGGYKAKRFNHSFIGFVGSERPEVVIAIRIEEAVPIDLSPLDLQIESYEAFKMVARAAIKHLGIRRSKDPDAGWPIRGTKAARELTPDRARPEGPEPRTRGGLEADDRAERAAPGDRAGRVNTRRTTAERSAGGAESRQAGGGGGAAAARADDA